MKKVFYISGALVVSLLILFSTGFLDYKNIRKEALVKGNAQYAAGNYEKALEFYAKGIEKKPEDFDLNFNTGQALYCLKDYQQALAYYEKSSPDKIEKYLNSGNCSLRLGDAATDDNEKLHNYQQALESYYQGILKFPQEVSLKYNYEYVKEKIKELQDNMNNNNESQQKDDNQQDENQQNDENQQENESGQNDENQQRNDEQENSGNQQENENQQNNEEQQDDGSQQNGENQQDNENQQGDESQEKNENQQNESNGEQAGNESNKQSGEQHMQEIEQALRALEKQEEDSLKNNQSIKRSNKEEKYDW